MTPLERLGTWLAHAAQLDPAKLTDAEVTRLLDGLDASSIPDYIMEMGS